jgi:hypothetical protein
MPAYLYALSGHLIDHVIPPAPTRQWVLSFPWPFHGLYAFYMPAVLIRMLGVITGADQSLAKSSSFE